MNKPPPAERIVAAALAASALEGGLGDLRVHAVSPARRAWLLLCMEARLVHPAVWAASLLVMAVCGGLALMHGVVPDVLLELSAPLVAGLGVAGLYGPEQDRAFELVAATPTSPRLVLLARVTLVYGYDLAIALAVSGLLWLSGKASDGPAALIASWLGPMTLLAALSLLLAVCWNPAGAIGVTLGVWIWIALPYIGARTPQPAGGLAGALGAALVLGTAAILLAGRGEPLRRPRS
ncbi:hypothetical protein [Nonomuraea sediminis]|uniref:hypothetical protein n=1 Tax=Nonomuraea sediminis TaxID=2835864 RepID=UPI001BDDA10B|nr:hypothetical protein [Nonomuraea sediminis]